MNLSALLQTTLPAMPDSVPDTRAELQMLRSLPLDELLDKVVSGLVSLAINIALAIVVFYIGKFVIRKIYNIVGRILISRHIDSGLSTFLLSMIRIVLYFILIVTVIGILGINTTSFLALFASAGVAIGMALSGTLQNFAGGVLILLLKPYRVGDYIEAQGYAGTVKEIQIFHTLIVTYDNKAIIIPNGGLSTGSVNNWSRERFRRVDWSVSIAYGNDVDTARDIILKILDDHPLIIGADEIAAEEAEKAREAQQAVAAAEAAAAVPPVKAGWLRSLLHGHSRVRRRVIQMQQRREEAVAAAFKPPYVKPRVVVDDLADSAVVLKISAWVKTPDYWSAYYSINEAVYAAFADGSRGISFPFPQLDVHLQQPAANVPDKPVQP